ncbi:death domain-associated protein 6-like [Anopheles coustani]|uniref:death domain-associated protein 6-like n=1 Tax=Anopheles coustani TaxID=139045 RepID=UPI00265B2F91|nr:death domain-associated protein 6-like [Anopheles coustani]
MLQRFVQNLNVVAASLVLILFGTLCSSYAIDCKDLWDEETLKELIEDEKKNEENYETGNFEYGEDWGEVIHEDEDQPCDCEDEADGEDEDEEGEHHQHKCHETASNHTPKSNHAEERRKRQLTEDNVEPRAASVPTDGDPTTDLEVAETHLFRPVFRYKSQYTERRRVRDNLAPSRQ